MEGLMTLPPLAHSYTLKNKEDFLGQNEDWEKVLFQMEWLPPYDLINKSIILLVLEERKSMNKCQIA